MEEVQNYSKTGLGKNETPEGEKNYFSVPQNQPSHAELKDYSAVRLIPPHRPRKPDHAPSAWDGLIWGIEQVELLIGYLAHVLSEKIFGKDEQARILKEYVHDNPEFLGPGGRTHLDPTVRLLEEWTQYYEKIQQMPALPESIKRTQVDEMKTRFQGATSTARALYEIRKTDEFDRPKKTRELQDSLAQKWNALEPKKALLLPISWVTQNGPSLVFVEVKKEGSKENNDCCLTFFTTDHSLSDLFSISANEKKDPYAIRSFSGIPTTHVEPLLRLLVRIVAHPPDDSSIAAPIINMAMKEDNEQPLSEDNTQTLGSRIEGEVEKIKNNNLAEGAKKFQDMLSQSKPFLHFVAEIGVEAALNFARHQILSLNDKDAITQQAVYRLIVGATNPDYHEYERFCELFHYLSTIAKNEPPTEPHPASKDVSLVVSIYQKIHMPKTAELHQIIYDCRRFVREYERTRALRLGPQWKFRVIARARTLYRRAERARTDAFYTRAPEELRALGNLLIRIIEEAQQVEPSPGRSLADAMHQARSAFEGELGLPEYHTAPGNRAVSPPPETFLRHPRIQGNQLTLALLDSIVNTCDTLCNENKHQTLRRYALTTVLELPRHGWKKQEQPDAWGDRIDKLGNYLSVAVLDRLAHDCDGKIEQWVPFEEELCGLVRVWRILDALARNKNADFHADYVGRFDDSFIHWYLQYNPYLNTGSALRDQELLEDLVYLQTCSQKRKTYSFTSWDRTLPNHEQKIVDKHGTEVKRGQNLSQSIHNRTLPAGMNRLWQHHLRMQLIVLPYGSLRPNPSFISSIKQTITMSDASLAFLLHGHKALAHGFMNDCRHLKPLEAHWKHSQFHNLRGYELAQNPLFFKEAEFFEMWTLFFNGLSTWTKLEYEKKESLENAHIINEEKSALAQRASCTRREIEDPIVRTHIAESPPSRLSLKRNTVGVLADPSKAYANSKKYETWSLYETHTSQLARTFALSVPFQYNIAKEACLAQCTLTIPSENGQPQSKTMLILPRSNQSGNQSGNKGAHFEHATVTLVALDDLARVEHLGNPDIQRELEQILFRPGNLEAAALGNPSFCASLAFLIKEGLQSTRKRKDLPAHLFLASLAHRIHQRLTPHRDEAPHIEAFCQTNKGKECLPQQIAWLLNHQNEPWIESQKELVHQARLQYYLSLGRTPQQKKEMIEVLVSYALFSSVSIGTPNKERDHTFDDRLARWMEDNLVRWESTIMGERHDYLTPVLYALRPEYKTPQQDGELNWHIDHSYPNFTTQIGKHTIALRLSSGLIFVDGHASGLVPLSCITEEYKSIFGNTRLQADIYTVGKGRSLRRCYRVSQVEQTRVEQEYEIQILSNGTVLILRKGCRTDGKECFFQLIRGPIVQAQTKDDRESEELLLPAEVLNNCLWSACDGSGAILLTHPVTQEFIATAWAHQRGLRNLQDKQGNRIDSLGNKEQLPKVLSLLDHPAHIKKVGNDVRFDRLGLRFTQSTTPTDSLFMECVQHPGYGIPRGKEETFDPFSDGTGSWILLEHRNRPNDKLVIAHGAQLVWNNEHEIHQVVHDPLDYTSHQDRTFAFSLDKDTLLSNNPDASLWLAYLFMAKGKIRDAEFYLERGLSGRKPSSFFVSCCEWIVRWNPKSKRLDTLHFQMHFVSEVAQHPQYIKPASHGAVRHQERRLISSNYVCGLLPEEFVKKFRTYLQPSLSTKTLPSYVASKQEIARVNSIYLPLTRKKKSNLDFLPKEEQNELSTIKGLAKIAFATVDNDFGKNVSAHTKPLALELCRRMQLNFQSADLTDCKRLFSLEHPDWVKEFAPIYHHLAFDPIEKSELQQWLVSLTIDRGQTYATEATRYVLSLLCIGRINDDQMQLDPEIDKLDNLFDSINHDPRINNNTLTFGFSSSHEPAIEKVKEILDLILGISHSPRLQGMISRGSENKMSDIASELKNGIFKLFENSLNQTIDPNQQSEIPIKKLRADLCQLKGERPAPLPVIKGQKVFNDLENLINPVIELIKIESDSQKESNWNKQWPKEVENLCDVTILFDEEGSPIVKEKSFEEVTKFKKLHHYKKAIQLAKSYAAYAHQHKFFDIYSISDMQAMQQGLQRAKESVIKEYNGLIKKVERLQLRYATGHGLPRQVSPLLAPKQTVLLERLLTLWERDQLSLVRSRYKWKIEDEVLTSLASLLEQIELRTIQINQLDRAEEKRAAIQKSTSSLRSVLTQDLFNLLKADHHYEKQHEDVRLRKILAIERVQKFVVRKKQLDAVNVMIKEPRQALQAATGAGKSSVITKLLTDLWKGYLPVVVVTEDEFEETMRREDQDSRLETGQSVIPFVFDAGSVTTAQALKRLNAHLIETALKGGKVVTTPSSLLIYRNRYLERWLELFSAQKNGDKEEKKRISDELDAWSETFKILKERAPLICDEMEALLDISKMVNIGLTDVGYIHPIRRQLCKEVVHAIVDDPKLAKRMHILNNQQRLHSVAKMKKFAQEVAQKFAAEWKFDSSLNSPFVRYVTKTGTKKELNAFYNKLRESHNFKKIVVLREILTAFPVLRQMHGVEVGRMKTISVEGDEIDIDDAGPYQAAKQPEIGSHIADPSGWGLVVFLNYVLEDVRVEQIQRIVNELKAKAVQAELDPLQPPPQDIVQFCQHLSPGGKKPQEITAKDLCLIADRINWLPPDIEQMQAAVKRLSQQPESQELAAFLRISPGKKLPSAITEDDLKNVQNRYAWLPFVPKDKRKHNYQQRLAFADQYVLAVTAIQDRQIKANAQHTANLGMRIDPDNPAADGLGLCGGYSGTMASCETFSNSILRGKQAYDPYVDGRFLCWVMKDLLADKECRYMEGMEIHDVFKSCKKGSAALVDDAAALRKYSVSEVVDWLVAPGNLDHVGKFRTVTYWDHKGRRQERAIQHPSNTKSADLAPTFVLFMQRDARGKDARLPAASTFTITVGEPSDFSSFQQAVGRARSFGERGQHVVVRIVPQLQSRLDHNNAEDPPAARILRYLISQGTDQVADQHFLCEPQKLRSYYECALFQVLTKVPSEERPLLAELVTSIFVSSTADDLTEDKVKKSSEILNLAKPKQCIARQQQRELEFLEHLCGKIKLSPLTNETKKIFLDALAHTIELAQEHRMTDPKLMTDDLQHLPEENSQSNARIVQSEQAQQQQQQQETEIKKSLPGNLHPKRDPEISWLPVDAPLDLLHSYASGQRGLAVPLRSLSRCFEHAHVGPNQGFHLREALKPNASLKGKFSLAFAADIEPYHFAYISYHPNRKQWGTVALTSLDYKDEIFPLLRKENNTAVRSYVIQIKNNQLLIIDRSSNVTDALQEKDRKAAAFQEICCEWLLASATINPSHEYEKLLNNFINTKIDLGIITVDMLSELLSTILNQQRPDLYSKWSGSKVENIIRNKAGPT